MLLALSIISLLIGPMLLGWLPYNRRIDNFLFAFVLLSVGGILLTDVIPALWSHIGLAMIPMVLLGFFGPGLIEMSFHKAADKAHGFAMLLGVLGLLAHSLIDGAGVVTTQDNEMLPYAVILHRLVVGFSLWWLVQPLWGNKRTLIVFLLMSIVTILGYYIGEQELIGLHNPYVDYFQALVVGTLLHVIIHRPHVDDHGHVHDHHHGDGHQHHKHGFVIAHKGYFIVGACVGLILLYTLHHIHF
ncbi:MAG: hypothetical protein HWD86_03775 [Kangiellaceae bacterium]|nr:hypothetical protein [Kangiellaceae bacterium]